MRAMNEEMVWSMMKMLCDAQGTNIDYVILWANTDYETKVCYNGDMDGGRYEFYSNNKDYGDYYTTDVNDAIDHIIEIDCDHIQDCVNRVLPNISDWDRLGVYNDMKDNHMDIIDAIARNIKQ